jgi:hypothetical protein
MRKVIPIPGILIAALTFPGVIVHEAAHFLLCKLRKVAVFEVCYFRLGNPAGYVIHEPIEKFSSALLVAIGPLIINSLLCIFFCFPAFFPMKIFGQSDLLSYFWMWLGISIGMHAFPSTGDAKGLWEQAKRAAKSGNALAWVSFPLVALIFIANLFSIVWFDAIYGIAIGWGVSNLVFSLLFPTA